jgi:hypothetical protein
MPAKAGIHPPLLDPRFHGDDDQVQSADPMT